jgi:hypothetical protein
MYMPIYSRQGADVPNYLQSSELVVAATGTAVARVLEAFLRTVQGDAKVFDTPEECGAQFHLDVAYQIRSASVSLEHPHFVFRDLAIDTTFNFRVNLDFSKLYDCIASLLPLPPRCIKLCVPFTHVCWQKCINLGSVTIPVPVPLSFNGAGLYIPQIETAGDEYHVYPEVSAVTPLFLDVGRIIQRLCDDIASIFPWPLSMVAGGLCDIFGKIFGLVERLLNGLAVDFEKLIFDATGGWVGVKLRFLVLLHLPKTKLPGTGTGPSNPAIPIYVDNALVAVNQANELEVSAFLHPATERLVSHVRAAEMVTAELPSALRRALP